MIAGSQRQDISQRTATMLVLATIIPAWAATAAWIVLNNAPPVFDECAYYMETFALHNAMRHPTSLPTVLFSMANRHGCVLQTLTAAGMLITGPSPKWAAIGNLLLLPLLVLSLYRLGHLLHSRTAGVLAGLFGMTAPIMVWLSHRPLEDFALTSMASLAMYFLARSEAFNNRKYALLYGATAGLAALTKLSFLLYAYLPYTCAGLAAAAVWLKSRRDPGIASRQHARFANVLFAGVITASLTAAWYLPHLAETRQIVAQNHKDGTLREPTGLIVGLLDPVVYDQLGVVHGVLALSGLIWGLVRFRRNIILWAAISGGTAFWLLWPNKDPRYTLPWLAVLAAWSGAALASIPRRMVRRLIVVLSCSWMLVLYAGVKFSLPRMPSERLVKFAGMNWTVYVQRRAWMISPPHRETWPYEQIVQSMRRDGPGDADGEPTWVLFTKYTDFFGLDTLELYGQYLRYPIFAGVVYALADEPEAFDDLMSSTRYILVCDSCEGQYAATADVGISRYMDENEERLTAQGSFKLPGGQDVTLYRLDPTSPPGGAER